MMVDDKIKEIVHREELPSITIEKKKTILNAVVESEYIHVKGQNLSRV